MFMNTHNVGNSLSGQRWEKLEKVCKNTLHNAHLSWILPTGMWLNQQPGGWLYSLLRPKLSFTANHLIAKANVSRKSNKKHLKVTVIQRNMEAGHAKLKKENWIYCIYDQRNSECVHHNFISTVCKGLVHAKPLYISLQFFWETQKKTFWKCCRCFPSI